MIECPTCHTRFSGIRQTYEQLNLLLKCKETLLEAADVVEGIAQGVERRPEGGEE